MKQHPFSPTFSQNLLRFLFFAMFSVYMIGTHAQTSNKPVFVSMAFLKTTPGKYNDYLNLIRTYGKKLQEHQVQQGSQMGWYLYEVLMPTGTEAGYNFVAVTVSTDMQQLMDPVVTSRELFQKVYPQMNAQQTDSIIQTFGNTRSMVKREIFLHQSGTNESGPPTKYAEVSFMTPAQGRGADYAKIEVDKFLPVHKQRMALGALKGWRFAQKVLPTATDDPYSFITVNFYDSFDMMMDGKYPEAVKKAWPAEDANKLFQQVSTVKKGQENQLWKLVDYTNQGSVK